MFEAVYAFLDPLARRMSRKNVERLFSSVLVQLFDSASEPHQRAQLLSRTTADLLLKRFSLKTFLERFLSFYLDAVIEPMRTFSKSNSSKRQHTNIDRLQSQSVLTLMASDILQSQDGGRERGRKTDFSFSLALSETAGHVDYDSDKEDSSGGSDYDEDDGGYSGEMSLLVKTDMGHMTSALSSIGEVSNEPMTSLLLDHHQENQAAGSGDEMMNKSWTDQSIREVGGAVGGASNPLAAAVDGMKSTSTSTVPSTSQSLLSPTATPDSPLKKGHSHSFSSVFSTEEPTMAPGNARSTTSLSSTSALEDVPHPASQSMGSHVRSQGEQQFPFEEEEEEEEMDDADVASTSSMDPETVAINSNLSYVAADCVSWLIRRLGPLLSTQHIAKPLVESLHRCFLGVVNSNGREVSVVKCLTAYAEYYGESVILKFYIPHAENLVSPLLQKKRERERERDRDR